MAIIIESLNHTGAELDQAVTDWMNTLTPVYTLPAQVKFSAVCNPTVPSVNVSWVWGDTEFASGIMVRRKLGSVPQHVGDGELVCNIEGTEMVSFEDTNFSANDATVVGTYDAPVIWYYRAFPYNVNGQYQTHYQTSAQYGIKEVGVYAFGDSGAVLSTLNLKDTFLFGRYGTAELIWRIMSIKDDRVYVALHTDQLFTAQFDAPEPNNTNANRKSNGSNRYSTSNVRQFLNATEAAGGWFEAQTDTDVLGSAYTKRDGFLYGFTEAERNLIIPETLTCLLPDVDGGGSETITDLVWLPSYTQMYGGTSEGEIFDVFADNNTNAARVESWAVYHWMRSFVPGTAHQARYVYSNGYAYAGNASNTYSLRAGLALPLSSFLTYDEEKAMFRVYAV